MAVVQVAISLLLVATAGMLTHSIYNLRNQDFGFHAENREIVTIEPPLAKYTIADLDRLYRELTIRLEAIRFGWAARMYHRLTGSDSAHSFDSIKNKPTSNLIA